MTADGEHTPAMLTANELALVVPQLCAAKTTQYKLGQRAVYNTMGSLDTDMC